MSYRVMEGGLADMATHMAGHFELPQRDILHHLQQAFRKVRERATQGFIEQQASEPENVIDPELFESEDQPTD
jgi:2-iminoacetate synthase ThiH